MQMLLVLYLPDSCPETIFAISAVAPVRTGLQLITSAFITVLLNLETFTGNFRSSGFGVI